MKRLIITLLLVIVQPFFCAHFSATAQYTPGAEVLVESRLNELNGKRVGLVVNHTSMVGNRHLIDVLQSENINVVRLFAPEHGLRGNAAAGEKIEGGIDKQSGLPVISLYGKSKKPDASHLKDLDVVLFDMQDVGVRPYTYVSTMANVMEAVLNSEQTEFWVLDRGNPLGGDQIIGWTMEEDYTSFVGMFPIPMMHGMTMGELAKMILGELWMEVTNPKNLRIIAAQDLSRSDTFKEWNRPWHAPSPNITDFQTLQFYSGMVLVEGTNLSEGRGTETPFRLIGAPGLRLDLDELYELCLKYDVEYRKTRFIPKSIQGKANNPKFENQRCEGYLFTNIGEDSRPNLYDFSLELMRMIKKENRFFEFTSFLNNLAGSKKAVSFMHGVHPHLDWKQDVDAFKRARQKYLIYE